MDSGFDRSDLTSAVRSDKRPLPEQAAMREMRRLRPFQLSAATTASDQFKSSERGAQDRDRSGLRANPSTRPSISRLARTAIFVPCEILHIFQLDGRRCEVSIFLTIFHCLTVGFIELH